MEGSRWRRAVGALILLVGIVLLIAIRAIGDQDTSCEQDVMFNLKGTIADCQARGLPVAPAHEDEKALVSGVDTGPRHFISKKTT